MAYRFKLDEPIAKGLRRIGLEQIERALRHQTGSGNRAVAVHETRKCLKRIRALLRLARPGLDDETFRRENVRFRSIAALLSNARDNQVLLETVLKLEHEASAAGLEFLEALRATLLKENGKHELPGEARIEEATHLLGEASEAFECLALEPAGFSVIERGLETCYRKGRHALAAAYDDGSDETFHEWRKAVQLHWRHMQLLSRGWPEMFAVRVAAARQLSQILGDDHDLSMLVAYLAGPSVAHLSETEAQELGRIATERQMELRREAAPRGEQLFAEGANGFSRHTALIWKAARRMGAAETAPAEAHEPVADAADGHKQRA